MSKKIKRNIVFAIIALFVLVVILLVTFLPKPVGQNGYELEIIAENLDTPWAIDFLPDGRMIFTERHGRVSILDNGDVKAVAKINVSEVSESGLLGIAV